MKWKDKLNPRYTQIAGYIIATAVIVYILGLVANNISDVIDFVMDKIGWLLQVIKPVILAFVVAYLLDPVIYFFEVRLLKIKFMRKKAGLCRTLGVVFTCLLVILFFSVLISLLVSSITNQIRLANLDDLINVLNGYSKSLTDFYNMLLEKLASIQIESDVLQNYVKEVGTYLVGILQSFGIGVVSSIANISGFLTTLLFTVIIGLYFMLDGRSLRKYWNRVTAAFISEKWNRRFKRLARDADEVFSGYIRGQLLDAFFMMVMIGVTLSIIGVKFAVLIGVLAGLGNLIPYVGPFIAYGCTVAVCLVNGDYKRLIVALVILFIIQTIDGNLIGPRLLSSSIQIHPLLVIVSLIFGSAIGGLFGMLLAVPVGALLKVLFNRLIDYRLEVKQKRLKE